jgi:hypothetical protein
VLPTGNDLASLRKDGVGTRLDVDFVNGVDRSDVLCWYLKGQGQQDSHECLETTHLVRIAACRLVLPPPRKKEWSRGILNFLLISKLSATVSAMRLSGSKGADAHNGHEQAAAQTYTA